MKRYHKRSMSFLLLLVLALTVIPMITVRVQAASPKKTGTINCDVQLTDGKRSDAPVLTTLHSGDQVRILKTGAKFKVTANVDQKVLTGYVPKQTVTIGDLSAIQTGPASAAPADKLPVKEPGSNKKIICLDPGHQGKGDNTLEPIGPGATEKKKKVSYGTAGVSTKVAEYAFTLKIGLMLQTELESRGYEVVMTRTTNDVNISNAERAIIANDCQADAFIRIHANGSSNSSFVGTETLCMSSKNPYNGHLHDLSYSLSQEIVDAMCELTGFKNKGVILADNMTGINWSEVPVTIVEMGYMSNAAEDKKMQQPEVQEQIVQGIANGIDRYFN